MKFKVAAIFQQGPHHLVKFTIEDAPAGDLLLGYVSKDIKFTTHPPTSEMGRGNVGEHAPKPMIREGEHFTSLTNPDGVTFELGKVYSFSCSPA